MAPHRGDSGQAEAGPTGRGSTATNTLRPRSVRRYRSPHRAQQAARTREAVLAAATDLFSARGWAGTSVRDVAAAAGVSVETVYSACGSKTDLLIAAVDVAVVGDTDTPALAERPEFAALASGDRHERALAAARLSVGVNRRTAGVHRALSESATSDPAAAARLRDLEEKRRTDVEQGLTVVAGRPVTADERDTVWAMSSAEVHRLLVGLSSWTEERYETWLADAVTRALAPDNEGERP